MATKKKTKQKPAWERAYKGHVLWLGRQKLGKVTLLDGKSADPRGKYHGYDDHQRPRRVFEPQECRGCIGHNIGSPDQEADKQRARLLKCSILA